MGKFLDTLAQASPLVSTGVGLFNSLLGSSSASSENAKNREFQAQQNALAYARQRQLIKDNPMLTKQGLLNAGMSPAAVGNYNGSSASVSTVGGPSGQFSPYVPIDIGQWTDAYLAMKQGEVADSQVNKNNADANKANEEAGVVRPLADAQINKLSASTSLDKSEIEKIANTLPLLSNQADYWKQMTRVEKNAADIQDATKEQQIKSMQSQYKLSDKEATTAYGYVQKLAQASYELICAQAYNNRASGSAALSQATTSRLEYEVDKTRVALQKLGVDADVELKGAQASYQKALESAVPSQIESNKASAQQSKAAAYNQRMQGKLHDAQRRNIPFDNMIKGVNTYFNGVSAATGAVSKVLGAQ